jgi:hypothetical protein
MMATTSDPPAFTDIWNEAFAIYQRQTGRTLQNDSRLKKLTSSDDLLSEIETQQADFGSFRNKHGRLWSALSTCLKPLDLLAHTAESAIASTPFVPAVFAGVFHLIKVCAHFTEAKRCTLITFSLKACQGVSDRYDYLEKLFSELEDFATRLQEYLRGEMGSSLRKRTAEILAL